MVNARKYAREPVDRLILRENVRLSVTAAKGIRSQINQRSVSSIVLRNQAMVGWINILKLYTVAYLVNKQITEVKTCDFEHVYNCYGRIQNYFLFQIQFYVAFVYIRCFVMHCHCSYTYSHHLLRFTSLQV